MSAFNTSTNPEERCVWMAAGLIAYKLCDRKFDCDACPLDAALRGMPLKKPITEPPLRNPDGGWHGPDDRRYHARHTWAQVMDDGRVRIGIDTFAATLLRRVENLIYPPLGSLQEADRPGCWIGCEGSPLPLHMPVGGRLDRINRALFDSPADVVDSPYDEGWLLEVSTPSTPPSGWEQLMKAAEMKKKTEADWTSFREKIVSLLDRDTCGVGPTLQDGGACLKDIGIMLGPRRYRDLMSSFL